MQQNPGEQEWMSDIREACCSTVLDSEYVLFAKKPERWLPDSRQIQAIMFFFETRPLKWWQILFWSNWKAYPQYLSLWNDPFCCRLNGDQGSNLWGWILDIFVFKYQGCIPFSWSSDPSWSRFGKEVRSNQRWFMTMTMYTCFWV